MVSHWCLSDRKSPHPFESKNNYKELGRRIIIIIIIIVIIIVVVNFFESKNNISELGRLNYYYSLRAFPISMVFPWSLSDSISPQVSSTLLSILAVLNNAVIWMISTRPPTSKSSSPFSNPLVTVPNAPITIGITATCMFHSFFNSLVR